MIYKPEGVCAQLLNLDIEDGIVKSVEFMVDAPETPRD